MRLPHLYAVRQRPSVSCSSRYHSGMQMHGGMSKAVATTKVKLEQRHQKTPGEVTLEYTRMPDNPTGYGTGYTVCPLRLCPVTLCVNGYAGGYSICLPCT